MRTLSGFILLSGAYAAAAMIGLQWAAIGGAGSPVWPAAGVGLAGLVLGGLRLWPTIIAGRLLAAVVTGSEQSVPVEVVIATGNGLATLAGAALLRRRGFAASLKTTQSVLLVLLASGLLAALSALVGTGTLAIANGLPGVTALTLFRDWWLGAFVGAVVVTALILPFRMPGKRIGWRAARRLGLMAVLTAAAAYLLFLAPGAAYLRPWLTFPILIWAALSFEVKGAAVAVTIVNAAAILGASLGVGPFFEIAPAAGERIFLSQQFAAVAAVTTLLLAAAAEERRGKEALARSRARLQAVLEAAELGSWHWDLRSGEVAFDRRWTEILGHAQVDFPHNWDTFEALCHPEDLPRVRTALDDYFEGRTDLYSVEIRMRHADGRWVWVLTTGGAMERDEGGRPVVMTGTHQDITPRVKQREALEASEARLRGVLDQLFAFVGLLSPEGRVEFANRAPLEAAGIDVEAVRGKPFEETFWWSFDPQVQARVRTAMDRAAEGETVRFDTPVRMSDGHRMMIDFQIGPMRGPDGQIIGLIPSAVDVDDRSRAFTALEASEKRARNIVESISDGFVTLDSDWRITYLNPLGQRILRPLVPPEQPIVGSHLWSLFPALRETPLGEAYHRAGSEREPQAVEGYFPPLDSWFDLRCYPLADGVAGHFLDISARKRAEAALRESEEQLRLALAAAKAGTFQVFADAGRPPVVSGDAKRLFGFDENEMPALETFLGRLHEEDRPRVEATIRESFSGGEGHYIEYRLVRPGGGTVWIASRAEAVLDEDSRTECLRGALIDITEHKTAEAERERLLDEVQRTNALITAISESSRDPIFAKDIAGRMLLANKATLNAVGKRPDEVLGRTDLEWWDDEEKAAAIAENDRLVMEAGEASQFEETIRDGAGAKVFLSTKAPLKDSRGKVIGLVGVSTDITERKAAEERLRLLNRELNHRVKNLFAVIRGLVMMSARGETDADALAEKLCERIQALAAAHLVSMDDEQLEPVPLAEVLRVVVAPYEHVHGRLAVKGPPVEVPRRFVTPLGLILHELATNAVKYGAWSGGDGKVTVRWKPETTIDGEDGLLIEWLETRAPEAAPPGKSPPEPGFGSQLMRASAQQIGGSFTQSWSAGSLTTRLTLPLGEHDARLVQMTKKRIAEQTEP